MFAVEVVGAAALNDKCPFEFAQTCVYGTPMNQNVKPSGIASEPASFASIPTTRVAPDSAVNVPALAAKV